MDREVAAALDRQHLSEAEMACQRDVA